MRSPDPSRKLLIVAILGLGAWGCSSGGNGSGTTIPPAGAGESTSSGNAGSPAGSGGVSAPSGGAGGGGGALASAGARASGGAPGTGGSAVVGGGGAVPGSGGAGGRGSASTGSGGGRGGASTGSARGGASAATGGTGTGGAGSGGAKVDAAAPITEAGSSSEGCTIGPWPTADPTANGPFKVTIENPVGPLAGAIPDGGTQPQFTLFRPTDMAQGGLCHPVITWGNGTGSTPTMYKVLLNNLASHGFVVIGSNSTNVGQGSPAPMLVGVTWVLQQNDDPTSELYHTIDTTHIGATGHSQGAFATSSASTDSRITTNVPICGAMAEKTLHGPAMFFCGGQDTLVGCSGAQSALNAVTTLPGMFAEYVSADHGSWMSFMGSKPSVVEATITAWMRVHLMGDTTLRPWFYGASCKLCTDSAWIVSQKNMDQ